jgi:hypothetical protein
MFCILGECHTFFGSKIVLFLTVKRLHKHYNYNYLGQNNVATYQILLKQPT